MLPYDGDETSMRFGVPESVVNIDHFLKLSRAAGKETASAQGWAQRPLRFESASGLDGPDQF